MKNFKKLVLIPLLASAALSSYACDEKGVVLGSGDTTVKLKGGLDVKYGHMFQKGVDKEDKLTANKKKDAINTEANIRFEIDRVSDEDFKYGAKIVVVTTTNPDGGASANGSHIWVSRDDLGKIEAGSPFSAARNMHVSAGEVSVGNGMTGWSDYAKLVPSKAQGLYFRDSDKLYADSMKGKRNEPSRRLSYYTPEFSGLQLGFSYTPDTHNVGDTEVGKGKDHFRKTGINGGNTSKQDVKDMLSYGVSFKHNLADGVDLKLALTGEYASKTGYVLEKDIDDDGEEILRPTDEKLGKLRAYNIGTHLAYGNWGFAGSYGNLGKSYSARTLDGSKRKSNFYTLGVGYKQGPGGVSLVHFNGNHRGNKLRSVSLAGSYDFARGLKGSVELTRFEGKGSYKEKNSVVVKTYKPKGYALVTGLSISL
ncbi:MAG: hypothetical protein K0Q51_1108 [Rickettsiaceae bacterium]|jgi:hypothetical protein|nr:hypothetical protein [Rickettsiaceae bacterium]